MSARVGVITFPGTLDDVDRGLVHALQIDGRAPLRAIATVIGVSENTIARRYSTKPPYYAQQTFIVSTSVWPQ